MIRSVQEETVKTISDGSVAWHSWFVLAVLTFSTFLIIGGTLTSIGVYVPTLSAVQGWTERETGEAATALLVGMAAASIVAGVLIDRFDPRLTLCVGIGLVAAGCAVGGLAGSSTMFVAAFAIIGVGGGLGTGVPAIAIIAVLFGNRRGLALGIYFGLMALSSGCVPPAIGLLIPELGWRGALYGTGAAIAICLPLALFMPLDLAGSEEGPTIAAADGLDVGQALRTPGFWGLAIAMTAAMISVNAIVFALIPYLLDGGYQEPRALSIYSVINLLSVPALLVGGAVADKWSARLVLPIVVMMQGLAALMLLGGLAPGWAGDAALATFGILWGASSGVPQIGAMLLEDAVGQRHFGTMLGINSALTGIISGFAPLLTGWLREVSGGYHLPFLLYGAVTCATVPLLLLVRTRFSPVREPQTELSVVA